MSFFAGNLLNNPIVNLTGAAIPTSYNTNGTRMQLGTAKTVSLWIKMVVAVGSSVTAIKFKLSARYDATVASSEVDLQTTDATAGTNSTAGEFSYTVAATNTYYKRLDCNLSANVNGDFVIQLLANASPNAGDSVVVNVVAW